VGRGPTPVGRDKASVIVLKFSMAMMLIAFRSITAQFGVTFYLRRLQQRDSRQVISQMGVAQLGLGDADLSRGGGESVGRYLVVSEQLVQGGLLGNQALSDRDRLCLQASNRPDCWLRT
jgi:hypothetical protein